MFIELSLALSILAHGGPKFVLNSRVETVTLYPDQTGAAYQHSVETKESDLQTKAERTTTIGDDSTQVITIDGNRFTIETDGPGGTKSSNSVVIPKNAKSLVDVFRAMGMTDPALLNAIAGPSNFESKETNETNKIAGVLCRKTVGHYEVGGVSYEGVTWYPVDNAYQGWACHALRVTPTRSTATRRFS